MKLDFRNNAQLKKWLKISAVAHVLLLLVIVFGLPHFLPDDTPITPRIIPVDIVNISEVTNTKIAEKPEDKPAPTPQAVEQTKPVQQQETPKPEEKPEPPKEKAPAPPEPPKEAEAIPDKTKPKEPEKPKEVKKPEEKKEDKKKPEETKSALANVLKNVEKLKQDIKPQPVVKDAPKADAPVRADDTPALAQELSVTEMDALRRQIQQCWNVPIGARGIENMVVEIYIEVNEDRTVRKAEVVDRLRMATDSFFRTVAESARRSLFHPKCAQLMLPPDRYKDWNKIRMMFNPADMF